MGQVTDTVGLQSRSSTLYSLKDTFIYMPSLGFRHPSPNQSPHIFSYSHRYWNPYIHYVTQLIVSARLRVRLSLGLVLPSDATTVLNQFTALFNCSYRLGYGFHPPYAVMSYLPIWHHCVKYLLPTAGHENRPVLHQKHAVRSICRYTSEQAKMQMISGEETGHARTRLRWRLHEMNVCG